MSASGVVVSSSCSLPALTVCRKGVVEKRSEHTSSFTEVIEISSDEERCLFLSVPSQSLCKVLTIGSALVLPKLNGEFCSDEDVSTNNRTTYLGPQYYQLGLHEPRTSGLIVLKPLVTILETR